MIASTLVVRGTARLAAAAVLPLAFAMGRAQQERPQTPRPAAAQSAATRGLRNPHKLTAIQLLEPTHPGRTPHVRFEWDAVPDAREYVLYGQWVSADSWTVQTREFRVTPRTATAWEAGRIAFDAALPEGSHSWNLVALYGLNDGGDFDSPTLLSFELR